MLFILFFSFLSLTTDRNWEEGLLVTWIGIDINVDLFMHVHLNVPSCSGLFSKYLKIFSFQNVYSGHIIINMEEIFCTKLWKSNRKWVPNKSIGSNQCIRVTVGQKRDPTDLQSLENGNFIGWWYIEHSNCYGIWNSWIHRRRNLGWEQSNINCKNPKGNSNLPDIVNCLFISISFLHEPPFRVFGSSRRSFLPELHVVSASLFLVPYFAWTALSGFRSTGKRIFA